jgi:hypothetical protein
VSTVIHSVQRGNVDRTQRWERSRRATLPSSCHHAGRSGRSKTGAPEHASLPYHPIGCWERSALQGGGCWLGSDIHVMLALCCRSRQVVMANEELHGPDMVGELLGKRQRRAYQPRNALSQRVVEPFDVIGCVRSLADRLVLRCRNRLPQPRGTVLPPGARHVCMAAPGQPHSHPAQGGEAGAGVKRIGRVPPRPEGVGHLLQLLRGHPALLQN